MTGPIVIEAWQLALSLVFVLAAGGISLAYNLGLAKSLAWGTVRTFAQLFLMGYALKIIFGLDSGLLVIMVFSLMIAFSARIVTKQVNEKSVRYGTPVFLSVFVSYMAVTMIVTGVIVGADPWWRPEYFLPMGGMVAGNSMNALALSLERLFSGLRDKREEVEMRLSLGADSWEASKDIVKTAIKAGMVPSINSMMGVGIVFIPGMMTGQIVAGADPMMAVRYQIVVMLMVTASTAVAAYLAVLLARKRCFNKAHMLVVSRLER
jgi:putative ABC transport system permease protein